MRNADYDTSGLGLAPYLKQGFYNCFLQCIDGMNVSSNAARNAGFQLGPFYRFENKNSLRFCLGSQHSDVFQYAQLLHGSPATV
jgi:hypothetical protein